MEILCQTEELVVCIKPAGVDAQSGGGRNMPALLRAELGGEIFPVHRLDRPAAGVMVFARTASAAAVLSNAIQQGQFQKTYLAVLSHPPAQAAGRLEDLLYHDVRRNKTYVVDRRRKGVRSAVLEYETVAQACGHALVRIRLLTGRTHQIRAQFASRGTPLLGDRPYGGPAGPLALWSESLTFPVPGGGQTTFSQSPPAMPPWTEFQ